MTYITPRVNNSMGDRRSITITLDNDEWVRLDRLCRQKNTSKQKLLEPMIIKAIDEEMK